jgi:aminoglycoside phosphotransferase family enzyme/predicted kinase
MKTTGASTEQKDLVAFLKMPTTYSHRPNRVRCIETHISWVFIVSPFVFKMKKPLNLGFLDFRTLKKRHHFCQRELTLNRRLAPQVYLEVLPIYKTEEGFSFQPGGKIVEYALKMKELSHGWFLRALLRRGVVGETEIDRIISRLKSFYDSETPTAEIDKWGRVERIKISTDENFEQVQPFIGRTITPVAFEAIRGFTDEFYARRKQLFQERIAQHRILDCHGDLHLDHIHITPDAVTIFDCIEFNDRFRFIDIANDLAFLAMDFDFERQHKLGSLFLGCAAETLRDPGIAKMADFYKCYRALVRGKVDSLQMKSEEHGQRARRYFQLAVRYATIGSGPVVLAVMGRIATGKSTVAKQLASELDWPVFSSDKIRKSLAELPLHVRTPPKARAKVYSEQMTKQTYEVLMKKGLAAVQGGGGVVLDATFSDPSTRAALVRECTQAGARLQLIELESDRETIQKRLKARDDTTAETSDARLEDFENLNATYVPPSGLSCDLIKASTSDEVSDAVRAVLLLLAANQAARPVNEEQ